MDGSRRSGVLVLFAAGVAAAAMGCKGGDDGPHDGIHNIYFMGTVIDGVLNTPLAATDPKNPPYEISLVYGTTTVKGKVDTSGRYTLGPLPAWNDYGIIISVTNAGDYRSFSSYNAGIAPPAPPSSSLSADIYTADTTQTFDFDAYVFPTSATAPDVTLTILETDQLTTTTPSAAGTIRIQPTSQSVIQGKTGEVGSQVWTNSQDLFASAITDTFTAGTYTVMGSKLVYGVSYAATVYGVDGHQPNSGTIQAGFTSSSSIAVTPLSTTPLGPPVLVSTSGTCHTGSAPSSMTTPIAPVTLTFNVTVADGTTSAGGDAEILDNGLYVQTSGSSTLKSNVSSLAQERGASVVFSGNTLTLGWTPSVGLLSPGSSDIVQYVYYQNLSSMYVEQPNHPESRISLGSVLGSIYPSGYITCGI
jgi:hypothetical protein